MDRILESNAGRLAILVTCILGGLMIIVFGPLVAHRYFGSVFFEITLDLFRFLGYALILLGGVICLSRWIAGLTSRISSARISPLKEELELALQRAQAEPEKSKPAWDLARVRLELYFDRNLSQINYIFWLSVLVMLVGFGFILFGISQTFVAARIQQAVSTPTGEEGSTALQPYTITPALVGGIAGVITEFIGATFLFIYRSTIQQANSYIKTLERINSVGMAMQILDTISTTSKTLQDQTKANMVKILLSREELSTEEEPASG